MKRRDFLKYGLTAGGLLLAGNAFAIPNRKRANLGIPGGGGSAGTAWSTWDETTEAGLANTDIFACLMENAALDGNETGQGLGLTGTNLVLTCTSIAGAVGGTRQTNVSSNFTVTEAFADALYGGDDQFSLVWKVNTLTSTDGWICYFLDNDSDCAPQFWQQAAAGNLRIIWQNGGEDDVGSAPSNSGVVYLAVWKQKSGNVFMGYKNGTPKPTLPADFTAIVDTGSTTMPNITANWIQRQIFGYNGGNASVCKLHYIVASKTFLF